MPQASLVRRFAFLVAPVLPTLVCAASAAPEDPARHAGEIVVSAGVATASDGSTMPYEIGTLHVPENRDKPDSRLIAIGFARVKAVRPTQAPPIFLLAGGPGITMLDIVLDHDDAAKRRVKAWQAYAEVADLVVIEQRGYTLRGELMNLRTPPEPLDQPSTIERDIEGTRALARGAQAAFPQADLSGYSITQMADDVNDLRRALGYQQISLVAASFGSQWAFAVMKRHPSLAARALISAAEPLDHGYDMPSQVFAAMQRIALEADEDPALKPYLPRGGLIAAIQATLAQRFAPGQTVVVNVSTEGGKPQAITLGRGDYQQALVNRAGDASGFPEFVISAFHGRHEGWAREALAWRQAGERSLINPLINIGLDMSTERKHLLWSDPALPIIGAWNFAAYLATKGEWATPDPGDAFRHPVLDTTPVLFVQGDWDVSTPIENTLAMGPFFPNSRTVIVHRAQHNGTFALLRSRPEMAAKVQAFLRTGETQALPAEITLDPVRFVKPSFTAPGTLPG
ncbi:MAG TPA: alpha/beta hydrolase [Ideonella sp.]|uniref:alpha/beta hydrolase n=1 Tax=Ideonella sp. TaxID=1929293 RepID=UPI002BAD14EF|nr:alpha/beta hydrolase [Ideonella sp.]HSI50268.1 alpha/beta hydrolase [Ideonella sp.]